MKQFCNKTGRQHFFADGAGDAYFLTGGRPVFFSEPEGKKYEKQEAIDIVKLESDKQVAVVQQKLDKMGGKFKGDVYDRLYDYYKSGVERSAKNGKLDQAEFDRYKAEMMKKTDDILKQYVPTDAQLSARKKEAELMKDVTLSAETTALKLGEIPKELSADTPAEKVQEKLQEYGNLSTAFNGEAQTKLGEINGYFTKLQQYQEAKNAGRMAYIWDKIAGGDDDKKVAELQEAKGELEGNLRKKKDELEKKKGELEKYGKSIGPVLAKKREQLIAARDADVKKFEADKSNQEETIKQREARYNEFKKQEEQLKTKKSVLEKSRDNLEKLRNADDSPQTMALKLERKKDVMDRVYNAESGKEEALTRALSQPDITDEQKQAIEEALKEIRSRKKRADDGRSFLAKGVDTGKTADAKLSQDERAVSTNLGTVESTLETFVYPTIESLDENLRNLKTEKDKYAQCAEGIKDKFDEGVETINTVQSQTDEYVLQCSLSNSLSLTILEDAQGKLEASKIDKQGVFGAVWDGVKDGYQGTIGKIMSIPGDLLTGLGKWMIESADFMQHDARDTKDWTRYIKIPLSEIGGLSSGVVGGALELVGGVLNIGGKPFDFLEGLGSLASINKQTGEIGDWSLAGQAWKGLGKGLISYDEFAEGHVSTGAGKIVANVLSVVFGSKGAEKLGLVGKAGAAMKAANLGKAAGAATQAAEALGTAAEAIGATGAKAAGGVAAGAGGAAAGGAAEAVGTAAKAIGALTKGAGKAVSAAEKLEFAAKAAQATKLGKVAALEKALEVANKAKTAAGNGPKAVKLAERVEAVTKQLDAAKLAQEAAENAAKAAGESAIKMRLAEAAVKEMKATEAALKKLAKGAGKDVEEAALRETLKNQAKFADEAINAAKTAAGTAKTAAEAATAAFGGPSNAAAALAESMAKAIPGMEDAVTRVQLAAGPLAKAAAVARGAASVTARTGVEGAKLAYGTTKFLVYEMPLGVIRTAGRLMKVLPRLTLEILRQGPKSMGLSMHKVGNALKVLEKEGMELPALSNKFGKMVTRNKDVMRDIFEGLKADAAFGNKFKDMEWNKIWNLIKKDPMLDALGAAEKGKYVELAKALESKAMTRFKALDTEAGAALERIKGAADDVLAFGAKDKRVAEILNKIFGRDLYVSDKAAAARAKAGAAPDAAVADAAAAKVDATGSVTKFVDQALIKEHASLSSKASLNPTLKKQLVELEKQMVQEFGSKYAGKGPMTADELTAAFNNEFAGVNFGKGKSWDIKNANREITVKFDDTGALKISEAAPAAAPAMGTTTPSAAPAVTASAPAAAAVEAGRASALVGYMKGKIGRVKELYAKGKANLPPSIKDEMYKLLSANAAIITYMPTLEKLHPEKPVDERIAEIEDRIAQIEAMGELPPDVVFPSEIEEMIKRGKDVK